MKITIKKNSLNKLLGKPVSLFEKFHKKTKIIDTAKTSKVENQPEQTPLYKEYLRLDKILLPSPSPDSTLSFQDVLFNRKSSRYFSDHPLSLEQLSSLLFYSCGLKKDNTPAGGRFYPSNNYPLETYLLSLNSDLPRGVYHYNLRSHSLEILAELSSLNPSHYFAQDWISKASCVILLTAIFSKTTGYFGDRGYRYILQESGHLGQNIYLSCAELDLSSCVIGGYLDDQLNELLNIDGTSEAVIYALAIGNK